MSRLVTFQLETGNYFVAEVDETGTAMRGSSTRSELIAESSETFETALQSIKQAAEGVVTRLFSLAKSPDELALEFGIKLSAEAGAFIAKTSSEANFSITMKWKKSVAEGR